ncbi:Response Regulator Receiver Signal Transduction Histidine Kinase [Trichormus variabilis ATCC 29413]|uniref:histidine kinase n=2 Tax=Anabaena variabilis TaxID=264691 RepID=Q3M714_TRIV2|nr:MULTISPECIES: hybrid sensor histidine kinase/response regulator [Nostocaceae]ABA23222.1 Response Regulator Receiver Signal Transduction Histidine Kinase [Trichormus variabilis ATCC 29413]MBC1212793.1 hybrid sensor histidine kinase/response regulator [Trichormus variabilis ARAD]MBC1254805.1 hybrid sensor histidine kinase/response regulator [Trichormus variabilis V5]MBC1266155.1 hybrid sensor histidine kinase/response regulator [Trichormus variabilis FSR]MBC1301445.1 hybrid sensor histidine k
MSLPTAQSGKILVVDDSPDNVFLIKTILEEEGYTVSTAENGISALAELQASPCDLVLLDLMMPGMDGYEVTRRVRGEMKLQQYIPILLITAHDAPNVAHGLDLGADDFIRKPVTVDELLARVRSLLRLKHSMDERDEIARQREDFVSRLTHDLRTPLVAADRMLALFQQGALGNLSPQMQEVITIMARSNINLLSMVNTLLEVYRFEAGRKTLAFQPVNLSQLLNEVIAELTPLAQEKNLAINSDFGDTSTPNKLGDGIPPTVGDRLELHRLFTNLIGNAIKFTASGSVTIRLKGIILNAKQDFSDPSLLSSNIDYVQVEIADTGAGIPLEEHATLFERFRQGSHKISGSGLGLYLSRRIVEAHHGKIVVNSELGKGSVFVVSLPIQIVGKAD